MIAIVAIKSNTGCPYAGGPPREVTRDEIVAFGKMTSYGSSVTDYVAELTDGTLVFLKAYKQSKVDEKWLRKLAKPIAARWAGRALGWTTSWADVPRPIQAAP